MTLLDAPLAKWKPGSALPPYWTSGWKVKTGLVESALRTLPQVDLGFAEADPVSGVIDHEPIKSESELFFRCSQRHSVNAAAATVTATIIFLSFMLFIVAVNDR